MTMNHTSAVLAQLRTALDLTDAEMQVAETRVQARTDAVRSRLGRRHEALAPKPLATLSLLTGRTTDRHSPRKVGNSPPPGDACGKFPRSLEVLRV